MNPFKREAGTGSKQKKNWKTTKKRKPWRARNAFRCVAGTFAGPQKKRVPLICAPLQFLPKKGGSRAPLKISALGPQKAKYLLEAQTGSNRAFRHWPEAVLGAPAGFRKSGVWAGSGSGAGPDARVPLICAPKFLEEHMHPTLSHAPKTFTRMRARTLNFLGWHKHPKLPL